MYKKQDDSKEFKNQAGLITPILKGFWRHSLDFSKTSFTLKFYDPDQAQAHTMFYTSDKSSYNLYREAEQNMLFPWCNETY